MAAKFKIYHRFDKSKAEHGVAHRMVDEAGNYYGTFTTSLFDPFNKYIEVANARYLREHGSDDKASGELANIFAFVEICLHDWKDVLDPKGKQVPFSKEDAFELLSSEDHAWLALKLIAATRDVLNYQGDPVATQDEVLGN